MGRPPKGYLLASLIEHESCISLKHSRCWNANSRLKSAREEGAGFFQITRAYYSDGRLRFDTLAELRSKYSKELYELNWGNIYSRPDLQIRAGILMNKELFFKYTNSAANLTEQFAFADAAYNGGAGGLAKEIRACYLASGCDHTRWFGHVENLCLKSKAVLYSNRSACDINRHHVRDVILIRSTKYANYYGK